MQSRFLLPLGSISRIFEREKEKNKSTYSHVNTQQQQQQSSFVWKSRETWLAYIARRSFLIKILPLPSTRCVHRALGRSNAKESLTRLHKTSNERKVLSLLSRHLLLRRHWYHGSKKFNSDSFVSARI